MDMVYDKALYSQSSIN